jgi:hypothetical protein
MDPTLFQIRPLSARQCRAYGALVLLLGLGGLSVGMFLVAAALQLPVLTDWLMPGVVLEPRAEPLGAGLVLVLAAIVAMGVLAVLQGGAMVLSGRRQMAMLWLMMVLLGLFLVIGFILLMLNGESWRHLNA